MKNTIEFYIENEASMQALGKALSSVLIVGDVIALEGDLGTGKTTLSKAIGRGLGVLDLMQSPTFAIANEYDIAEGKLIHSDVYRLSDEDELYAIGFEDYFNHNNIVMIEWADLIRDFLTYDVEPTLWINLGYQGEGRRIRLTAEQKVIENLEKIYDFSN